ncbi:MAG TPA: glycosyltransferase [Thermoanaerobaculia bacterium]|jgi:glycosyltransferase involved in cell wall biosynthesis
MRITIVIGGLGGGGAERVCVNLANVWAVDGRDVTILTVAQQSTTHSAYPVDPRVARRTVGWPREPRAGEEREPILLALQQANCHELAGDASMLAALRQEILATAPDVVVSHMDRTNIRVLAALLGTGVPVIACEHTDVHRVSVGLLEAARAVLYRRAGMVVASHEGTTAWLTRQGIPGRTIANPLVPPQGGTRGPMSTGRRRRVVTLSRLSREKRVDLILRAFAIAAEGLPGWELEVYGDGPLRAEMASLTAQLGLQGRAFLRGFTDDPYGALGDADLYVSASAVEGFGNAIWEALACGVPVVALDCGAPVRALVRDGVDGRIISGTYRDLAAVLGSLIRDEAARAALASRAPEVLTRFGFDAALRAWDEVLQGAVAEVRA